MQVQLLGLAVTIQTIIGLTYLPIRHTSFVVGQMADRTGVPKCGKVGI
ncbi:hypothetical protein DSM25559_4410 [Agrobacterium rosae]|uniref:Uncharacterized protein n=1 Tax=Agrobacterium rosae TaxID=1972867 RepID=A0A1R3U0D5_9HYPH|nr:hypothetical protein DSM25559_4410 [Agrobacterium rosae]